MWATTKADVRFVRTTDSKVSIISLRTNVPAIHAGGVDHEVDPTGFGHHRGPTSSGSPLSAATQRAPIDSAASWSRTGARGR